LTLFVSSCYCIIFIVNWFIVIVFVSIYDGEDVNYPNVVLNERSSKVASNVINIEDEEQYIITMVHDDAEFITEHF